MEIETSLRMHKITASYKVKYTKHIRTKISKTILTSKRMYLLEVTYLLGKSIFASYWIE